MNVQKMNPKEMKLAVKEQLLQNNHEPDSIIKEVIRQLQGLPDRKDLVCFFGQVRNVLGQISASERHKYLTLAFRRHGAIVTLSEYRSWSSRNSSRRSSSRNGYARA